MVKYITTSVWDTGANIPPNLGKGGPIVLRKIYLIPGS
jgi:hypothetical protein